jgi:hypothetical protein
MTPCRNGDEGPTEVKAHIMADEELTRLGDEFLAADGRLLEGDDVDTPDAERASQCETWLAAARRVFAVDASTDRGREIKARTLLALIRTIRPDDIIAEGASSLALDLVNAGGRRHAA